MPWSTHTVVLVQIEKIEDSASSTKVQRVIAAPTLANICSVASMVLFPSVMAHPHEDDTYSEAETDMQKESTRAESDEIELRPDGEVRFRAAVHAAAKSGPKHREPVRQKPVPEKGE